MKNITPVDAIILAAGSGSRMGGSTTKQRMNILGESILKRCVGVFSSCKKISNIIVVSRPEEIDWAREELAGFPKLYAIVCGGKTRAESAKLGFEAISPTAEYVAIHDAARCLVTNENISDVIDAAIKYGAATAGSFVTDTIKQIDHGVIENTIPREGLFAAHTPQIFLRSHYENALDASVKYEEITDDNMMLEKIGVKVYPVETGKENIKITKAEDIGYAEYVIERRRGMMDIRVGHGYDAHRLVEGRALVLGGVKLPYDKGLLGHSDADVLSHAIIDAILGACGLGDIGRLFPDSDEKYKDISSLVLLKEAVDIISQKGFSVENIDSTIVIQSPKIARYIGEMVTNISNILGIEEGRVNIKATTEEHMGFTGREEGISAHAVVIVKK